jgi:hypothetical protein
LLNLKNYKEVPKPLLKRAEKCAVRECDEVQSGRFEAYVDEGDDSFDVSLQIANKIEIAGHSCDCGSKAEICQHCVALIKYLAGTKKKKPQTVAEKNKARIEKLLDDADPEKLKAWVQLVVTKNKDLELSLTSFVSAKKEIYTREEMTQLTNDAIKTVIGRKSRLDATQFKKIIQLWETISKPVVDLFQSDLSNRKGFDAFDAHIEACLWFQFRVSGNIAGISKYLGKMVGSFTEPVSRLIDDDVWLQVLRLFHKKLFFTDRPVNVHYLQFFKSQYELVYDQRKKQLVELLADSFDAKQVINTDDNCVFALLLLSMVEEQGLFARYSANFYPLRFRNHYNLKLIDLLIGQGSYKQAEKIASDQIQSNQKPEFNIGYWERLKTIYKKTGSGEKLNIVIRDSLLFSFDFDDYLALTGTMEETEAKKFRSKLLLRVKANINRSNQLQAWNFYFRLLDHEKSYKQMINNIDKKTPLELIVGNFKSMFNADKGVLLNALLSRHESFYYFLYEDDNLQEDYDLLPGLIREFYPIDYIRSFLKAWTGRTRKDNAFLEILMEMVGQG